MDLSTVYGVARVLDDFDEVVDYPYLFFKGKISPTSEGEVVRVSGVHPDAFSV
jgi:hypothetical protein